MSDDERAGQLALSLPGGARLVRLPPGLAADRWWITFVLSGGDTAERRRRESRWYGVADILQFEGPVGPFTTVPTHGGADDDVSYADFTFDVGVPWIRVSYVDAGVGIASETLQLG